MVKTIKVKLVRCPDIGFSGTKLTEIMKIRDLTRTQLAVQMKIKGWPWYYQKVYRLEGNPNFKLHPQEMQALLKILGASGI